MRGKKTIKIAPPNVLTYMTVRIFCSCRSISPNSAVFTQV